MQCLRIPCCDWDGASCVARAASDPCFDYDGITRQDDTAGRYQYAIGYDGPITITWSKDDSAGNDCDLTGDFTVNGAVSDQGWITHTDATFQAIQYTDYKFTQLTDASTVINIPTS